MKLTILCGSLTPGTNGVGDYARLLAAACAAKGHSLQLVSVRSNETNHSLEGGLRVDCFTDAQHAPAQQRKLLKTVSEWQPDWISLQFAPFDFHPLGLVQCLVPLGSRLAAIAPMALMCHELWLGQSPSSSLKHRLLGRLQRHQMLHAITVWKPFQVQTSNPLYRDRLARHGIEASLLPLFGNIPIIAPEKSELQKVLPGFPALPNQRMLLFPFSQSADWPVDFLMHRLNVAAQQAGVSLSLIQVGANRLVQKHWRRIETFSRQHGWTCHVLGPQSDRLISQLMQVADLGVSSAHLQSADRSGAVVAMLEHGLPVMCSSRTGTEETNHSRSIEVNPLLFSAYDPEDPLTRLLKKPFKHNARSRLSEVADRWLLSLSSKFN